MNKKILLCISLVLAMLIGVFGIVSSASDEAVVSVYKLVDYETDTQVDLKYYEFIGNATNNGSALEKAAAMIAGTGANGGLIDISEGTLTVTNRQDITAANIVIKGAGKDATTVVGNAANFNNATNGLKSSSLSSEYKAVLGLHGKNIKVMDLTISGGDCGYSSSLFSVADFKTVRVNSGVSYFERVDILGLNGRTNLMIGTSTTASTVYTNDVFVEDPTSMFYGPTEIVSGSTVDFGDSYVGGFVVGSTDNLGAGYYELHYLGRNAYTTIPYAIGVYECDDFATYMADVLASESAQGVSVAAAMTADLTTVLENNTTLLYGNSCDGMRALAWNFRAALIALSAETNIDAESLIAKLDEALELDSWHCGVAGGTCEICGATGLNSEVKVETPALDDIVAEDVTKEDKDTVKNIVADIVANESVAKVDDTGLTAIENVAAVEAAKDALVELGVAEEVANAVAPVVTIKVAEVVLAEDKTAARVTYNVSPVVAVGDKSVKISTFEKEITFRLPISSDEDKAFAKVYHESELLGIYDIVEENGSKFVEVASKTFSAYSVEPTAGVAKIGETEYTTIEAAVEAAVIGDVITVLDDTVDVDAIVAKDGTRLGKSVDGKQLLVTDKSLVTFKGASIRYILADGSAKDTNSADIRFSYVFSDEFAFEAGTWGWNYKLDGSEVMSVVAENYDETGRTNLVFANVNFENFGKAIESQIWFKITVDGVEFTVCDNFNTRTVIQVVDGTADYQGAGYEGAKVYASELRANYQAYLEEKGEN